VVLPGPGDGEWIWPWWLQRQLDPASPAWLPADLVGRNRTGRNWTVIGVPDSPERWIVDRRGLLAPVSGRWALDWWVGAEDRWRLPSREASTQQRLLDGEPVVETVLRVPGGEVVARHWAEPGAGGTVAMMEVENASAAPVALALALRPVGPRGATGTQRVSVLDGRLVADGVTVLRADLGWRQSVVSTGQGGDVAATVLSNRAGAAVAAEAVCPAGWAGAAVVWPLAHRATLRVEIPGRPEPTRPAAARPDGPGPRRGPGPVKVARGWASRASRVTRLELPAGPLGAALEAQRRHLLLAGTDVVQHEHGRAGAARVVAALATAGLRDEAGTRLDAWLDGQHRSGLLGRDGLATAATLWALERWARTGPDDGRLARSLLAVARAAECIARTSTREDAAAAVWSVAGLGAAARMLATLGEDDAAARVATWTEDRRGQLVASLASQRVGDGIDPKGEAALLAVVLGALPAQHALARSALAVARRPVAGIPAGAVATAWPSLGLRPESSLTFAGACTRAGDDPFPALGWVLSVASSTWTWPTVVDPRLGTGSHGSGHDPVVAAALWDVGRAVLVADPLPSAPQDAPRLEILPALPPAWLGAGLEVHGLDTAVGPLSFALRWHGERPGLLWEIGGDGPDPVITAPGLDRDWLGRGRRGEALLAPVVLSGTDPTPMDPTPMDPTPMDPTQTDLG
jgi:hypothetical protein